MKLVERIIRRGAGHVSNGWRQKSWGTGLGADAVCVEGGMARAGVELGLKPDADELAAAFAIVGASIGQPIPEWNDAPERTQEQAVDLLTTCADAVAEQTGPMQLTIDGDEEPLPEPSPEPVPAPPVVELPIEPLAGQLALKALAEALEDQPAPSLGEMLT